MARANSHRERPSAHPGTSPPSASLEESERSEPGDADWRTIVALIRICLVGPDPGVDPARVAALPKLLKGGDPDRGLHAAAIISLRLGRNDADLPALQTARDKYQWDTQRFALARVFHARGDHFRARRLMNQVPIENRNVDPTAGSTGSWEINMEIQLWYRQAEAVIQSERWCMAEELVRRRQWIAAIDALGPLLHPEDKSGIDWGRRATCFAELGRWREAAADFALANALGPEYVPGALMYASACLRLLDRDQYRDLCRRTLEYHAASSDPDVLNNVGWLWVLDSSAEMEAERALALVAKAFDKTPNNTNAHTHVCLLYRAGRHADSVERLNELIARPGYGASAYDWLFLAMAHHRLDQKEPARKYLDQSVASMAANCDLDWQRRAELEHFRAEAEALIVEK